MITKKDFKVIEINKDADNIIFIDRRSITIETAQQLAESYKGSRYNAIVLLEGIPEHAVKLLSVSDLKEIIDDK